MVPNPLGNVPVGRNLGETGYNFFKREQWSAGYDFSHRFNDTFSIQQNLKYFDVKVDSRAVFGAGLVDADFNGVPDDFRTVNRFDFPFNERIDSLSVDTRAYFDFDTGGSSSTRCSLASTTATTTASRNSASASAPAIDLFDPVYDAVIPPATIFPFIDETREQIGVYLQDQLKLGTVHPDAERPQRLGRARSDDRRDSRRRGVHLPRRRQLRLRQRLRAVHPGGHVVPARFRRDLRRRAVRADHGRPGRGRHQVRWPRPRPRPKGLRLAGGLRDRAAERAHAGPGSTIFFSVQEGEVEVKGVELEVAPASASA